ncbi:hypothetical protein GCM10009548_17450 [Streptomyces malaysiensis subsp. malaysiensis]
MVGADRSAPPRYGTDGRGGREVRGRAWVPAPAFRSGRAVPLPHAQRTSREHGGGVWIGAGVIALGAYGFVVRTQAVTDGRL